MKKIFSSLFVIAAFVANAQVKNYFPSAANWESKTPTVFNIDTNKLNQAVEFAKNNETKYPKNLWLSQAMQFGKEPFSDPVGPMASRGGVSGIILYKGYIIAKWGDPNAVEMVNSVTKSFLSTVVGLAVDQGLIKSIDDKVYTYLPPIEVVNGEGQTADQNPIAKTSFIYPLKLNIIEKLVGIIYLGKQVTGKGYYGVSRIGQIDLRKNRMNGLRVKDLNQVPFLNIMIQG